MKNAIQDAGVTECHDPYWDLQNEKAKAEDNLRQVIARALPDSRITYFVKEKNGTGATYFCQNFEDFKKLGINELENYLLAMNRHLEDATKFQTELVRALGPSKRTLQVLTEQELEGKS